MLQESAKSTFKGLKGVGTSKFRRKHIEELGRTDSKGSVIVSSYRDLCLSVYGGNACSDLKPYVVSKLDLDVIRRKSIFDLPDMDHTIALSDKSFSFFSLS